MRSAVPRDSWQTAIYNLRVRFMLMRTGATHRGLVLRQLIVILSVLTILISPVLAVALGDASAPARFLAFPVAPLFAGIVLVLALSGKSSPH